MTAFRQLPGYVFALVYLVTSVVAPSLLLCHGHDSVHAGSLGGDAPAGTEHACCGHGTPTAPETDAGVEPTDHEPCHTLGGSSHTRPADDLVAAERGELPDLPPVALTADAFVAELPRLVSGRRATTTRARAPPARPPRVQRPATLLL